MSSVLCRKRDIYPVLFTFDNLNLGRACSRRFITFYFVRIKCCTFCHLYSSPATCLLRFHVQFMSLNIVVSDSSAVNITACSFPVSLSPEVYLDRFASVIGRLGLLGGTSIVYKTASSAVSGSVNSAAQSATVSQSVYFAAQTPTNYGFDPQQMGN